MSECPCGLNIPYAKCCEPLIQGLQFPETAEQLLRSRYTAFVKHDIDYIMKTVHPKRIHEFDENGIREWSENSEWLRLEIIKTENGSSDDQTGTIEFKAYFSQNDIEQIHHESASFTKVKDQWFFEDAEIIKLKPYLRENPKVGRNDPCPCGSGKKFKKCCNK